MLSVRVLLKVDLICNFFGHITILIFCISESESICISVNVYARAVSCILGDVCLHTYYRH